MRPEGRDSLPRTEGEAWLAMKTDVKEKVDLPGPLRLRRARRRRRPREWNRAGGRRGSRGYWGPRGPEEEGRAVELGACGTTVQTVVHSDNPASRQRPGLPPETRTPRGPCPPMATSAAQGSSARQQAPARLMQSSERGSLTVAQGRVPPRLQAPTGETKKEPDKQFPSPTFSTFNYF